MDYYPSEHEDFAAADSSKLDTWVFDKVKVCVIKIKKIPVLWKKELIIFLYLRIHVHSTCISTAVFLRSSINKAMLFEIECTCRHLISYFQLETIENFKVYMKMEIQQWVCKIYLLCLCHLIFAHEPQSHCEQCIMCVIGYFVLKRYFSWRQQRTQLWWRSSLRIKWSSSSIYWVWTLMVTLTNPTHSESNISTRYICILYRYSSILMRF